MSAARTSPSGPLIRLTGDAPVARALTSSVGVQTVPIGAAIPVTEGSYLASAFVPMVGTAAGNVTLTFTPTVGAAVVQVTKPYSVGTTQTYVPVLPQVLDIPSAGNLQWNVVNASGTAVIADAAANVQPVSLET